MRPSLCGRGLCLCWWRLSRTATATSAAAATLRACWAICRACRTARRAERLAQLLLLAVQQLWSGVWIIGLWQQVVQRKACQKKAIAAAPCSSLSPWGQSLPLTSTISKLGFASLMLGRDPSDLRTVVAQQPCFPGIEGQPSMRESWPPVGLQYQKQPSAPLSNLLYPSPRLFTVISRCCCTAPTIHRWRAVQRCGLLCRPKCAPTERYLRWSSSCVRGAAAPGQQLPQRCRCWLLQLRRVGESAVGIASGCQVPGSVMFIGSSHNLHSRLNERTSQGLHLSQDPCASGVWRVPQTA